MVALLSRWGGMLPAPGYRDYGRVGVEGDLGSVGRHGYSWSSTANGVYGVFLDFYQSYLSPSGANNRAYGLQVRCLRA